MIILQIFYRANTKFNIPKYMYYTLRAIARSTNKNSLQKVLFDAFFFIGFYGI